MFSKEFFYEEAVYELYKIKDIAEKINRDDLIYKSGNKKQDKKFDFEKFKIIKSFGREIYCDNLTLDDVLGEQINWKDEIEKFWKSTKPENKRLLKLIRSLKGRQRVLNGFGIVIFPIRPTQGKRRPLDLALHLRILTTKQMKDYQ